MPNIPGTTLGPTAVRQIRDTIATVGKLSRGESMYLPKEKPRQPRPDLIPFPFKVWIQPVRTDGEITAWQYAISATNPVTPVPGYTYPAGRNGGPILVINRFGEEGRTATIDVAASGWTEIPATATHLTICLCVTATPYISTYDAEVCQIRHTTAAWNGFEDGFPRVWGNYSAIYHLADLTWDPAAPATAPTISQVTDAMLTLYLPVADGFRIAAWHEWASDAAAISATKYFVSQGTQNTQFFTWTGSISPTTFDDAAHHFAVEIVAGMDGSLTSGSIRDEATVPEVTYAAGSLKWLMYLGSITAAPGGGWRCSQVSLGGQFLLLPILTPNVT